MRGIAGKLGFRPFSIQIVRRGYADQLRGAFAGDDPSTTVMLDITEGDGYAPRVRWLEQRDYARGYPTDAQLEVGPITPLLGVIGTSVDTLEQLTADYGDEIYYLVTGPGFADGGSRFQLHSFNGQRALGYTILLKRASDGT